MVNRYTTSVLLQKHRLPRGLSNEEILDVAVEKACRKRLGMNPENVTDVVVNERDDDYIITVNWWPHRGDQI